MTISNILGYSTTAASNTDVGGVSIVENCAAANLNNGIRAVMADLAKHLGDTSGKLVSTGTPNAYVISNTNRILSAYDDGAMVTFRASFTNTGTASINIDGRGAKTIKNLNGSDLAAGAITLNGIFTIAYNSATGFFYLMNPAAQAGFAGILPVVNGGTGLAAYGVGDLICAAASTTLARLPDIGTGNVLLSGGVGIPPIYGKVTLPGHITGILPVVNGGTGLATGGGAALDNISGFAGIGSIVRTAAATYAFRTDTGTTGEITVVNGNGASGNPTFSLSSPLILRDKVVHLKDANTFIVDDVDITKALKFECTGISPGATRFITIPDASGTLALINTSNTYTVPQTISNTLPTVNLTLTSTDGNTLPAPGMSFFRNSTSPFANDYGGYLDFQGKDSAGGTVSYGQIRNRILDATTISGIGELEFFTVDSGIPRMEMGVSKGIIAGIPTGSYKGFGTINAQSGFYDNGTRFGPGFTNIWTATQTITGAGLVLGVPTGGDKGNGTVNAATGYYENNTRFGPSFANIWSNTQTILVGGLVIGSPTGADKGPGTINVAGDIYKNNSPYTNPDFVFESFYNGDVKTFAENRGAKAYQGLFPLDKLRDYTKENFRLPGIDSNEAGVFERTDIALEKIEELTLYILGLHDRIRELEERLNGDNK